MTKNRLLPWRVKASRHIHKDRWISVRADDCITADGVDVSPFYVLEYPDVVLVLAITADNQIILVRQYRHGLGDVTTPAMSLMICALWGSYRAAPQAART
jgi:hypothetical protein